MMAYDSDMGNVRLANVRLPSPGKLGALGTALKKENISASTLGLGLGARRRRSNWPA